VTPAQTSIYTLTGRDMPQMASPGQGTREGGLRAPRPQGLGWSDGFADRCCARKVTGV